MSIIHDLLQVSEDVQEEVPEVAKALEPNVPDGGSDPVSWDDSVDANEALLEFLFRPL